jgi:hypothetical protein
MLNLLIAEYGMSGDASKERDVYSFGIFAQYSAKNQGTDPQPCIRN